MKLDFNILWLENQRQDVESYAGAIQRKLKREGFELNVEWICDFSDLEKVEGQINEYFDKGSIDLIFLDYDLGSGQTGNKIASIIRKKFKYKDIVFYSGKETSDLLKMMAEEHIQGVYCAHRNHLTDHGYGVIETIIRKTVDVDHMRGIVMAATSDFDQMIVDGIHLGFAKLSEQNQTAFCDEILNQLGLSNNSNGKKIASLKGKNAFAEMMRLHSFSSSPKRAAFSKLLHTHDEIVMEKPLLDKLSKYKKEVTDPRNKFAHVSSGSSTVSEADLKKLRVQMLQHRENFEKILSELK